MQTYYSCTEGIEACMQSKRFAVSHLIKDEKTKSIHLHDCHEIYYSIEGGKQFFINDRYFDIRPGDVFFITQNESHHITQVDQMNHERINIAVYPSFLVDASTSQTDLAACFKEHSTNSQQIHLSGENQQRFLYLCHKLNTLSGYGVEILENGIFCEIMVMLNREYLTQNHDQPGITREKGSTSIQGQGMTILKGIIDYLNENILRNPSLEEICQYFHVSKSYVCRVFKQQTGTTIREYLSARRISLAKTMLDSGQKPNDVCVTLGFLNYSTFYKVFISYVGVSPQNYVRINQK